MGNACTPTQAVSSQTTVLLRRQPSWGPKSSRGPLQQATAASTSEVAADEAGDTPIMYPPAGGECMDCFQCCKKGTPEEVSLPEKPFKSAVAIVRHGERVDQIDPAAWFRSDLGRAYPFDCPLTSKGRQMAREVAEDLQNSGLEFALVVCSPYVRCVQTAAEMCQVLGLQLAVDAELGEIYGPRTHGQWKRPPPRRSLQEISNLTDLNGIPLIDSPMLVRNDGQDFFGTVPTWPENLEDARLRLVSRVEQYLARGLQLRRNFVLVTHGDCVAASLGLLLASQLDRRRVVTKIEYCAYAVAERTVEPAVDMIPLGLADDLAGWSLKFGNCQVSDLGDVSGQAWKGPYDPYPIQEEAQRLKDYEEGQQKTHQRKMLKKSSTTVLKSAIHRQRSKDVLGKMEPFDVQFGELVPETPEQKTAGGSWQISTPQDIVGLFTGGRRS